MPEWSRVGGLEEGAGGTRRKPPWLVLSLGFGGLLVFIVAAATGTLVVLDRVRHQETQIRQAFLQRTRRVEDLRVSHDGGELVDTFKGLDVIDTD